MATPMARTIDSAKVDMASESSRMYLYGESTVERFARELGIVSEIIPAHTNEALTGEPMERATKWQHWSVKMTRKGSHSQFVMTHSLGEAHSYSMPWGDGDKRPKYPTPAASLQSMMGDILSCELCVGTWDPAESWAQDMDMCVERARKAWAMIGRASVSLMNFLGRAEYDRLRSIVIDTDGGDYRPDPLYASEAQSALQDLVQEFLGESQPTLPLGDAANLREHLVRNVLRGDFFEAAECEPEDGNPISYRALGARVKRALALGSIGDADTAVRAHQAIIALDDEFTGDDAMPSSLDARIGRLRHLLTQGKYDRQKIERLHEFIDNVKGAD